MDRRNFITNFNINDVYNLSYTCSCEGMRTFFKNFRFHGKDNQWVPSVQHISSTLKGHSFSAPKIPQFNTPLSFTPKTTRFNTNNLSIPPLPLSSTPKPLSSANPLSSTPKPFGPNSPQFNRPLRQKLCRTEEFLVWN